MWLAADRLQVDCVYSEELNSMELENSRQVGPDTYLGLPVPWGGAETIEGGGEVEWRPGYGQLAVHAAPRQTYP